MVSKPLNELALATSLMGGFEPDASAIAITALLVVFAAYDLVLAAKDWNQDETSAAREGQCVSSG